MPKIRINNTPNEIKVKKTIGATERYNANIEVEVGEAILTNSLFDGLPELFMASGKKHYDGGTPLKLADKSFIFSNADKMKIQDEVVLDEFNQNTKKNVRKGISPADLAKQYDLNKYRKTLSDPTADRWQRETAKMMIDNYATKLGQLALVQEADKGFPQGVPHASLPYLAEMNMSGLDVVTAGDETAENGGQYRVKVVKRPTFSTGGEENVEPHKSKTDKGKTTPTGRNSDAQWSKDSYNAHYKALGINADDDKTAQAELYDKADPFMKAFMWGHYGKTGVGSKDKLSKFAPTADELENFGAYKERMLQQYGSEKALKKELAPLKSSFADGQSGARTSFLLNNFGLKAGDPAKPALAKPEEATRLTTGEPYTKAALEIKEVKKPGLNQFWTQDMVNMAGAVGDFNRIKKYMPWESTWQTKTADPTFYDPTRELAANSEQAAISGNILSTFTGPQATSSRLSDVQGNALANAANILGKYSNLNVGIDNQFEMANTEILNNDSHARSDRATRLYDKGVIANQQYDNSKALGRQKIRDAFNSAWTNRGRTQALNSVNKQYKVDPTTGFIEHTGVEGVWTREQQMADFDKVFNETAENPLYGGDSDKILRAVKIKMGMKDLKSDQMPYDSYNPAFQ